MQVKGNVVDIPNRKIYPAVVHFEQSIISIEPIDAPATTLPYILPGFIDAHVHIESSMLVPSEFARLAVVHGTVATISDPHEIANVCGIEGVDYMIENGRQVPFKFYFGAPSCVPATAFETAGAYIDADAVKNLLARDEIKYLSEMMNFPGVLNEDAEVMQKLAAAHEFLKPVDGHAPGLRGDDMRKYIAAGISTDHECFTAAEALEKMQNGMKIIIREGSAAKNFEALIELLHQFPSQMMFCSDDKHPDSLVTGHINQLCARAVAKGIDPWNVLQAACINPVKHYKLDVGYLQQGQPADFIVVKDLVKFDVLQTYINGNLVAAGGNSLIRQVDIPVINNFKCSEKQPGDFAVTAPPTNNITVIEALDGQLITNKLMMAPAIANGHVYSDTARDILKLVVVNRYNDGEPSIAFVKNFGLKEGAIASTVAHDSHNIIAVGADDESICQAINSLIKLQGGICCITEQLELVLPLPVAGLMSTDDGYKVAEQYALLDASAKAAGSTLSAPFMTLSFMALLVIPHLKLSDKGLFDGDSFSFI